MAATTPGPATTTVAGDLHAWTNKFRDLMDQLRQQVTDARRREADLAARLVHKEEQLAAVTAELDSFKRRPTITAAQKLVLDPAVNILFSYLRWQLKERDTKLEQLKEDLEAFQFNDTSIGARLKAKCRMLIEENEELGKQLSEKRVEQAERALVAERKAVEELKVLADGDDMLTVALEEIDTLQNQNAQLSEQLQAAQQETADLKAQLHEERDRVALAADGKNIPPCEKINGDDSDDHHYRQSNDNDNKDDNSKHLSDHHHHHNGSPKDVGGPLSESVSKEESVLDQEKPISPPTTGTSTAADRAPAASSPTTTTSASAPSPPTGAVIVLEEKNGSTDAPESVDDAPVVLEPWGPPAPAASANGPSGPLKRPRELNEEDAHQARTTEADAVAPTEDEDDSKRLRLLDHLYL